MKQNLCTKYGVMPNESNSINSSESSLFYCLVNEEEQRQMRRVAFFAVVVSTMAVIVAVITLPMMYAYVQSFQSYLISETDFCKVNNFM